MVSIVVFRGEPEKNIYFEIRVRLTPSTLGPKILMKTLFSAILLLVVLAVHSAADHQNHLSKNYASGVSTKMTFNEYHSTPVQLSVELR